jgi:hypothetical protein
MILTKFRVSTRFTPHAASAKGFGYASLWCCVGIFCFCCGTAGASSAVDYLLPRGSGIQRTAMVWLMGVNGNTVGVIIPRCGFESCGHIFFDLSNKGDFMGGFIVGLLVGSVMAFCICYRDLGRAYDAMEHSQARAVKAEREVEQLVNQIMRNKKRIDG